MQNNQKKHILIVVLILVAGSVLRFWDFFNIPFMFDELSAMGRTTYDSFSDLIRYGVVERDSHPAGVQVFLFYWVKLFGDSEAMVKLPFILGGIASVWIAYLIGKLWFGPTTGILTAAMISSLQLFVMYSQIARPYGSGLFITLMMVWFWSRYFFEKPKTGFLVGFALFGALAAYNHHFSLLFAATVGLTGLLFTSRKTVVPYLLSGVGILLLYLPHFSILFAQAEKGTIGGWLGAPGADFLLNFVWWLFHESVLPILTVFVILILLLLKGESWQKNKSLKKRVVLILWLLPAPIFGYIYSYLKEPILQNSLLIFTTPYFFLWIFSFGKEQKPGRLIWAVVLVLWGNIGTLMLTKDYFVNFYRQPFQEAALSLADLEEQSPGEVFYLNDYVPYFTDYYLKDFEEPVPYFTTRNTGITLSAFDSLVSTIDEQVVFTNGLDDQYFQVIKKYFPYWIGYDHGFTFEHYTLSKVKQDPVITRSRVGFTDFLISEGAWKFNQAQVRKAENSDSSFFAFEKNMIWGPKFSVDLSSIDASGYFIIDVEISLETSEDLLDALLVAEIKNGGEQLSWRGFSFRDFNFPPNSEQKFYATIDIQKALNNGMDIEGSSIDLYIWNPEGRRFKVKEIQVFVRPGNPGRYRL